MENKIEVTVVLPCLNEEKTIGSCIQKINEVYKTHAISGEVVVADNGSTDRSKEIAQGLGARVVYEPHRGYGAAYQCGLRYARGAYIVIGDSDDTYDFYDIPKFLEPLKKGYDFVIGNGTLSGDGEVEPTFRWQRQIVGAHCKTADNWANTYGIGIVLVGNFDNSLPSGEQMASLVKLVSYLQKRYDVPTSDIYGHGETPGAREGLLRVDSLSGAALMLSVSALDRIGVLEESYFHSFEDVDWCARAREAGLGLAVVLGARARHGGSRTLGPASAERLYYAARNHLLAAERTLPLRGLSRALRAGRILGLNLLHALRQVDVPRQAGLRAVLAGAADYRRGRFGPRGASR